MSEKHDGRFLNPVATGAGPRRGKIFRVLLEFLRHRKLRRPSGILQTRPFSKTEFENGSPDALRICWFGHSSSLIDIGGKVILTDPVFSERASMFRFAGPKRFAYSHHAGLGDMPALDAVIISHDHYDHLDKDVIGGLQGHSCMFFVPLGVGPFLRRLGISGERIRELDWWETAGLGELEITSTPARHFSGRSLRNRMGTLWCSWVIRSRKHRVYFSGDSGYYHGFREIGNAFGPFDLVLMECGAYSEYWPDIHMQPEQSVQAALDVRAQLAMPVHWGKFNLSLHPWKEPVERFLAAAATNGLKVITPLPGETLRVNGAMKTDQWWAQYP